MAAAVGTKLPLIVAQTQAKPTGSLIFLHGSGSCGADMKEYVRFLSGKLFFPHIRILYPTARTRPYTLNQGEPSNVWFDRVKLAPDVPEHVDTIKETAQDILQMIEGEVKLGIPLKRIVVGGFSMGGAMALHIGYKYTKDLAGVFALSSFLNEGSQVYKELEKKPEGLPPLLMCHGGRDTVSFHEWGLNTFNNLQALGVQGRFESYNHLDHELSKKELVLLQEWLLERIPVTNGL